MTGWGWREGGWMDKLISFHTITGWLPKIHIWQATATHRVLGRVLCGISISMFVHGGGGVGYHIVDLSASRVAMSTEATCYSYEVPCLLSTNWLTVYVRMIFYLSHSVTPLPSVLTYLVNKKLYPGINAIFVLAFCSFQLGNLLLEGGWGQGDRKGKVQLSATLVMLFTMWERKGAWGTLKCTSGLFIATQKCIQ